MSDFVNFSSRVRLDLELRGDHCAIEIYDDVCDIANYVLSKFLFLYGAELLYSGKNSISQTMSLEVLKSFLQLGNRDDLNYYLESLRHTYFYRNDKKMTLFRIEAESEDQLSGVKIESDKDILLHNLNVLRDFLPYLSERANEVKNKDSSLKAS